MTKLVREAYLNQQLKVFKNQVKKALRRNKVLTKRITQVFYNQNHYLKHRAGKSWGRRKEFQKQRRIELNRLHHILKKFKQMHFLESQKARKSTQRLHLVRLTGSEFHRLMRFLKADRFKSVQ